MEALRAEFKGAGKLTRRASKVVVDFSDWKVLSKWQAAWSLCVHLYCVVEGLMDRCRVTAPLVDCAQVKMGSESYRIRPLGTVAQELVVQGGLEQWVASKL